MVLSVPAPPVRAAGLRITSSMYGSDVTDSVNFLTSPPDFVGTQSVAQSVANTSWTPITLDTSQTDPYSGHSLVTNTSRWTCPLAVPGWYTVGGVIALAANATGFRCARLQVNGSPVPGAACYSPNNGAVELGVLTPVRDIQLQGGDYVEVACYQSSGGSLNTIIDADLRSALWLRFSHA